MIIAKIIYVLLFQLVKIVWFIVNLKKIITSNFAILFLKSADSRSISRDDSSESVKEALIIAIFPRRTLLKSTLRFIEFVSQQGYFVIAVVNGNSSAEDYVKALNNLKFPITIIVRNNIGRDFAAYKTGFNYVIKNKTFENLKKLAFFNDSCIYTHNFDWFLELNAMKSDVSSLFVNTESIPHFQAMSFICSEEVIRSESMINFWDKYRPSQFRIKTIKNGEHKLTKTLTQANFIIDDLARKKIISNVELFSLADVSHIIALHSNRDPHIAYFEKTLSLRVKNNLNTGLEIKQLVDYILGNFNNSHFFGVFLTQYFGFPLKLDILKSGYTGLLELHHLFEKCNFDENEINLINYELRFLDKHKRASGLNGLFNFFGLEI